MHYLQPREVSQSLEVKSTIPAQSFHDKMMKYKQFIFVFFFYRF
jgi:hypothetical protein